MDLHWADPTTVELVRLFLASPTTSPLALLVMSTRNEASDAVGELGEEFEQADRSTSLTFSPCRTLRPVS